MKIKTSHPVWSQIYPNMRKEFDNGYMFGSFDEWREDFIKWAREQGVEIIQDSDRTDGKFWPCIILPDDPEELTALIIKWS